MTVAIADPGSGCACVTIGAAARTILAAWAFVTLGTPAALQRTAAQQRPEARLGGYDAWDLEDFLRRAGSGARDLFRRELVLHMLFAVVFGTGIALLLLGTWGRVLGPGDGLVGWLAIVLAVAGVVMVMAESVLLLRGVSPGTEGPALRRPDLVPTASVLSKAKWLLVAFSLVAIAAGAVTLAFAGTARF